MAGLQILTNGSAASGESLPFKISTGLFPPTGNDSPFLQIYGTLGSNTAFTLKAKAPDGIYYTTAEIAVLGIGVWQLPYNRDLILKLTYTNSGGSPDINAYVYGGVVE